MSEYSIVRHKCYEFQDRLSGKSITDFERKVMEKIKEGWTPLGGMVMEPLGDNTVAYVQTMWRTNRDRMVLPRAPHG